MAFLWGWQLDSRCAWFARAKVGVDTDWGTSFRLSSYIKIGVVVILLLILVAGPLLQIYDCFNDPPNLDHDALLHTIDALLSIALILAFNLTLFCVSAMLCVIPDALKLLRSSSFTDSCNRSTLSLGPPALLLRI